MLYNFASVGFHYRQYANVLENVATSGIATGDLITNGKVTMGDVIAQPGGISLLKSFQFMQVKTSGTLYTADFDLLVFNNTDQLTDGAGTDLVSGDAFQFDSDTTINNLIYVESFVTADYYGADLENNYIASKEINQEVKPSDLESSSLGFALVSRESSTPPLYANHDLYVRFNIQSGVTQ